MSATERVLRQRLFDLVNEREIARRDAKVLAHAYLHAMHPQMDVVQRAYAYHGIVPVDVDDEPTQVTVPCMRAVVVK